MGGAGMKWLMRIAGVALLAVGLVPLTPLVFLLVLVPGNPGGIFNHLHLQFWQTQSIGATLAAAGAWLLYHTNRRA